MFFKRLEAIKEIEVADYDLSLIDEQKRLLYNVSFYTNTEKETRYSLLTGVTKTSWDPNSLNYNEVFDFRYNCVKLAENLAKNNEITVFASPSLHSFPWTSSLSNPQYLYVNNYLNRQHNVTFCLNLRSLKAAKLNSKKTIYLPHETKITVEKDSTKGSYVNPEIEKYIDHIVWFSEEQRELSPALSDINFDVMRVPFELHKEEIEQNKEKRRKKYSCLYIGEPDEKLDFLLECWQKIKEKEERATLKVLELEKQDPTTYKRNISDLIEDYEDMEGVEVVSSVDLNEISYFLYPASEEMPSEAYFNNILRVQECGCIPITTDYTELKEEVCPCSYIIKSKDLTKEDYVEIVHTAFENDEKKEENKKEIREEIKEFVKGKERSWEEFCSKLSYIC
jgi:hypothetical protein